MPNEGQAYISTRWVLTSKIIDGKICTKARLVARGFEENQNIRSDSPTCMRENIRILFTIDASFYKATLLTEKYS